MRMKIIAASILALGMASSAFAQSNPAPTGATIDSNQSTGAGGGANADTNMKKPMVDSTTTNATSMGTMSTTSDKPCNGNDAASSTGNGSLQTQGGTSNATPQDTKCSAHSN